MRFTGSRCSLARLSTSHERFGQPAPWPAYRACRPAAVAGSHVGVRRRTGPPRAPGDAPETIRIALLSDLPQWPAAEERVTALLDQLAERKLDLVVHAGGIKGDTESCSDTVLQSRQRLLDQSALPLVYVPGETDWAECHHPVNGNYDAVERLNRLRELFFPEDATLGSTRAPW